MFTNLRNFLGLQPKALCMVVSEQEDCEIWIDGRKTSHLTPKLVAIPKNKKIMIEVRKDCHEPHRAWVQTGQDLCFHYCELERVPLRVVQS